MIDLKNDLSTLTTINESTFSKLINKVEWCISDGVEKAIIEDKNELAVDIGIGILLINFTNDEVKYKFKPNPRLEKVITNTIVNERNDLVLNIENSLVTKLTNVYKNFF